MLNLQDIDVIKTYVFHNWIKNWTWHKPTLSNVLLLRLKHLSSIPHLEAKTKRDHLNQHELLIRGSVAERKLTLYQFAEGFRLFR